MNNMISIGRESGILKGFPEVVSPRDAKMIPRKHLLVLASGSQGEQRAASAQLARDSYMGLTIQEGDVFLFSSAMFVNRRCVYIICFHAEVHFSIWFFTL